MSQEQKCLMLQWHWILLSFVSNDFVTYHFFRASDL